MKKVFIFGLISLLFSCSSKEIMIKYYETEQQRLVLLAKIIENNNINNNQKQLVDANLGKDQQGNPITIKIYQPESNQVNSGIEYLANQKTSLPPQTGFERMYNRTIDFLAPVSSILGVAAVVNQVVKGSGSRSYSSTNIGSGNMANGPIDTTIGDRVTTTDSFKYGSQNYRQDDNSLDYTSDYQDQSILDTSTSDSSNNSVTDSSNHAVTDNSDNSNHAVDNADNSNNSTNDNSVTDGN